MATYLATIDTGRWRIRSGRTPGGVPQTVAVDRRLVRKRRNAVRNVFRTTARGDRLRGDDLRPVPVRLDGRDRRRREVPRPDARLLARDADAPGVLRRPRQGDDRPRDRAPVVRQQRVAAQLGRHLAQRGLRLLRRVPVDRPHDRRRRARRRSSCSTGSRPRTASGRSSIGNPGRTEDVRHRRLLPRGDDAAGAAREDRRRAVLQPAAHVGWRPTGTATRPPSSSWRSPSRSPGRTSARSSRRGSTRRASPRAGDGAGPAGGAGRGARGRR